MQDSLLTDVSITKLEYFAIDEFLFPKKDMITFLFLVQNLRFTWGVKI